MAYFMIHPTKELQLPAPAASSVQGSVKTGCSELASVAVLQRVVEEPCWHGDVPIVRSLSIVKDQCNPDTVACHTWDQAAVNLPLL